MLVISPPKRMPGVGAVQVKQYYERNSSSQQWILHDSTDCPPCQQVEARGLEQRMISHIGTEDTARTLGGEHKRACRTATQMKLETLPTGQRLVIETSSNSLLLRWLARPEGSGSRWFTRASTMEGRCERRDDGWWLMVPDGGSQDATGVGPFPCLAAADQAALLLDLHAALASEQPQEEVQRLQAELEVSSGTLTPLPPPPAVQGPARSLRAWWPRPASSTALH